MSLVSTAVTVLIVDHNPIFLNGIISLIQSQRDLKLVGTATDERLAMNLFLQHQPRIVLMDLDLPNSLALLAIREMKKIAAQVTIIGMVTYEFDPIGELAIASGARAIVSKERIGKELIHAVRRVGGIFKATDASNLAESN